MVKIKEEPEEATVIEISMAEEDGYADFASKNNEEGDTVNSMVNRFQPFGEQFASTRKYSPGCTVVCCGSQLGKVCQVGQYWEVEMEERCDRYKVEFFMPDDNGCMTGIFQDDDLRFAQYTPVWLTLPTFGKELKGKVISEKTREHADMNDRVQHTVRVLQDNGDTTEYHNVSTQNLRFCSHNSKAAVRNTNSGMSKPESSATAAPFTAGPTNDSTVVPGSPNASPTSFAPISAEKPHVSPSASSFAASPTRVAPDSPSASLAAIKEESPKDESHTTVVVEHSNESPQVEKATAPIASFTIPPSSQSSFASTISEPSTFVPDLHISGLSSDHPNRIHQRTATPSPSTDVPHAAIVSAKKRDTLQSPIPSKKADRVTTATDASQAAFDSAEDSNRLRLPIARKQLPISSRKKANTVSTVRGISQDAFVYANDRVILPLSIPRKNATPVTSDASASSEGQSERSYSIPKKKITQNSKGGLLAQTTGPPPAPKAVIAENRQPNPFQMILRTNDHNINAATSRLDPSDLRSLTRHGYCLHFHLQGSCRRGPQCWWKESHKDLTSRDAHGIEESLTKVISKRGPIFSRLNINSFVSKQDPTEADTPGVSLNERPESTKGSRSPHPEDTSTTKTDGCSSYAINMQPNPFQCIIRGTQNQINEAMRKLKNHYGSLDFLPALDTFCFHYQLTTKCSLGKFCRQSHSDLTTEDAQELEALLQPVMGVSGPIYVRQKAARTATSNVACCRSSSTITDNPRSQEDTERKECPTFIKAHPPPVTSPTRDAEGGSDMSDSTDDDSHSERVLTREKRRQAIALAVQGTTSGDMVREASKRQKISRGYALK